MVSLEYWYLKKNPEALIERVTVNDDTVEYIKRLVDSITSIMTNGVIAPRTYSFTQDKLQKKDSDIKTIDNCKNCEVSNICYTEHQEMWKSLALKNKTEKYREATGDLEESNTQ